MWSITPPTQVNPLRTEGRAHGPKDVHTCDVHAQTIQATAIKFARMTKYAQAKKLLGSTLSHQRRDISTNLYVCETPNFHTQTIQPRWQDDHEYMFSIPPKPKGTGPTEPKLSHFSTLYPS